MGESDYKSVEKYCEKCGIRLVLKINRDIVRKRFCSQYCSSYFTTIKRQKENPNLLIKFREAGSNEESNRKRGIHPNYKPTHKIHSCLICHNSFKVQFNRHNKGYGKCCSINCYRKYNDVKNIKIQCLNCGKDVWDKPYKNRKYCSCSCRALHLFPRQKYSNTDIELKIKSFLKKEKISFKFQPPIKGIVNADFLIYPNIVIFADGDYWHSLPYAVKRDAFVNKKLAENSYTVLRFKGTEIHNDFNSVKNKIRETINAGA